VPGRRLDQVSTARWPRKPRVPAAGSRVRPPEMGRLPRVQSNVLVERLQKSEYAQRLVWGGLVAGLGAIAAIAANRLAATIWRRVLEMEPPD
jgi:hypothetical protein